MKFVQRLMLVGFLVSVTVLAAACTKKAVTQAQKQPVAVETVQKDQPATSETAEAKPLAISENEDAKKPTSAEVEEIEQLAAIETDKKEQPAASETEEAKLPTPPETVQKEQPAASETETDKKNQPATSETEEAKLPTPPETVQKEQPAASETETDKKEQPATSENEEKEQPAEVKPIEKKLQATLKLWDGQDGIVGMLGYVWTIEPSGEWSLAHFVNDKISDRLDEGKLTPEEMTSLVEILESQSFQELPRRLYVGDLLAVYARMLTVHLENQNETTLFFKAGEPVESPGSVQLRITLTRFANIVKTIKQLTNHGYAQVEEEPGKISLATGR